MTRIAIVLGSTRPSRRGHLVAHWALELAEAYAATSPDLGVDLIDLADYDLPLLDEPHPPRMGDYAQAHTLRWASAVAAYDGFVFVTPEYNHSYPAVLKNAIDYLYAEWADKAAGFISYGVHGGTRAVEHLRLALAELQVATVRSQVALSMFTDFALTDPIDVGTFTPQEHQAADVTAMLDELVAWTKALERMRAGALDTPDMRIGAS